MAQDYISARIDVEGLNDMLRQLRKFGEKDVPEEIRRANLEAAQLVVPVARAEAPKVTGKLASTVRATATAKAGSLRAGRGRAVPYAGPIHFGWLRRHIRANPFLERAAARMTNQVVSIYVRALDRAIARFNA